MKRSRWNWTFAFVMLGAVAALASFGSVSAADPLPGGAEAEPVALDDGAVELECDVKKTDVSLLAANPLKIGLTWDCNTDGELWCSFDFGCTRHYALPRPQGAACKGDCGKKSGGASVSFRGADNHFEGPFPQTLCRAAFRVGGPNGGNLGTARCLKRLTWLEGNQPGWAASAAQGACDKAEIAAPKASCSFASQ